MPFYVIVKLDNTSFYAYFYTRYKNSGLKTIIFKKRVIYCLLKKGVGRFEDW